MLEMSGDKRRKGIAGGGEERRSHPRLPVAGISGGFLFSTNARILNLSLEGMALETSDYLQVGRSYALKLTHDEEVLALRGRVVWCRLVGTSTQGGESAPCYSAGLQFENLISGAAREVHRFLGTNAVISLEKRLFGRFRLHQSESAGIDHEAAFRVEKISLSGLEIVGDTFVEPETVIDLALRLGDERLSIRGRVVHGRRLEPRPDAESAARLGIEFLDMDGDTERAIRSLIRDAIR